MHKLKMDSVLDIKYLASVVGDKMAQIEVLQSFYAESVQDLAQLDAAILRWEALHVIQTAHRLKGACAMVGALEMRGLCYQIEMAGRDNDLRAAVEVSAALAAALPRLIAVVEYLHTGSGPDAS